MVLAPLGNGRRACHDAEGRDDTGVGRRPAFAVADPAASVGDVMFVSSDWDTRVIYRFHGTDDQPVWIEFPDEMSDESVFVSG